MLGKYLKINDEQLPNPVSYSDNFAKVSNIFQSEAGDDLVIDVRVNKYSADMTFNCSSTWKNKLKNYAALPYFTLEVNGTTMTVRCDGVDSSLVEDSEKCEETQGYWVVNFTVNEL